MTFSKCNHTRTKVAQTGSLIPKVYLRALVSLLSLNIILSYVTNPTMIMAATANTSEDSTALLQWSQFTVKYKDRIILNLSTPGSVYQGRVLGLLGPSG